jgi:predicted nucleic-acid-binding Zn-ribbon protein
MDINEIELMWKEDSKIDQDNLHEEALKIPVLHSKYHEIQNKIYQVKKVKEAEYNSLYAEKTLYYAGKADPEVYQLRPFPHKVLKNDIPLYLNSDEELVKIKTRVDYCNYLMSYLSDILKMIHNRSFQIRDSIEWSRFIAGQ